MHPNVKDRFGKIRKITPDIIMEKKKITFFLEIEKKSFSVLYAPNKRQYMYLEN